MPQVRGTFDALYDNVDKAFFAIMKDRLREIPRIYTQIFNVRTSDRKFERVISYVPFGDTSPKPEGEPITMDTLRPGHTKDFTHTEFALGFEVTQTALEDDPEGILNRAGEWLAFSARYVEEGRAANVFNNGFSASETTPDGVSLFNGTHVLKGGGTARNVLSSAADLSATSLMQALTDLRTETKDEAGHLADVVENLVLYVPPALEFTADRIINSQLMPGVGDNDRNPIKALRTWKVVVNPRLSDADAWFLVAGNKAQHALTFYRRVPITMLPMDIDPRTKNRIFACRHRFSVGAWAWQNTFGTPGA